MDRRCRRPTVAQMEKSSNSAQFVVNLYLEKIKQVSSSAVGLDFWGRNRYEVVISLFNKEEGWWELGLGGWLVGGLMFTIDHGHQANESNPVATNVPAIHGQSKSELVATMTDLSHKPLFLAVIEPSQVWARKPQSELDSDATSRCGWEFGLRWLVG